LKEIIDVNSPVLIARLSMHIYYQFYSKARRYNNFCLYPR